MPEDPFYFSKGVLEPNERISEMLFGLIMVLTFTGSLSVAEAGRDDVRAMLIGALGCNLAWGVIDAVFFLMSAFAERGHNLKTLRAIRNATDTLQAQKLLAGALPPVIATVVQPADLETMCRRLKQLPEPPDRPRLRRGDWLGAIGVFLLVFASTFPVAIPFVFMHNAMPAMRLSNAIAILMLFLLGYISGHCAGHNPWVMGISMVFVGSILVALTIVLGG